MTSPPVVGSEFHINGSGVDAQSDRALPAIADGQSTWEAGGRTGALVLGSRGIKPGPCAV
jgi:hypothetical protein